MQPKKTTIESELDEKRKALCDLTVQRAAELMTEAGASAPMIIDRLLTYAFAQACLIDGSPKTAKTIRRLAENVEAGCFYSLTGEGSDRRHN